MKEFKSNQEFLITFKKLCRTLIFFFVKITNLRFNFKFMAVTFIFFKIEKSLIKKNCREP